MLRARLKAFVGSQAKLLESDSVNTFFARRVEGFDLRAVVIELSRMV